MNSKKRSLFFICLGLLFGMSVMYIYNNFIADKKENSTIDSRPRYHAPGELPDGTPDPKYSDQQRIDQLTEEKTVINYVKQNHKLPDYYITKIKPESWAGILQKEIFVTFCPAKRSVETSSATEKEHYRKERIILKPMSITTVETEMPTGLFLRKTVMFILLKIIIRALKSSSLVIVMSGAKKHL